MEVAPSTRRDAKRRRRSVHPGRGRSLTERLSDWARIPFVGGCLGGFVLWLAFPPVGIPILAWLGAWPWLWLIRNPRAMTLDRSGEAARVSTSSKLDSGWRVRWFRRCRGPWGQLYFAGVAQWLLWTHWVRLPHWSANFGWLALAGYLAVYLPLFVGCGRLLVQRRGWPAPLAAAVVWTALEYMRGHLFTGFSLMLLGHTQVTHPWMIQTADWGGAYAVGFVVMCVSGATLEVMVGPGGKRRFVWGVVAAGLLAANLGYGAWRTHVLDQASAAASADSARIGLIQGSFDTTFDDTRDPRETRLRYAELSRKLIRDAGPLDGIVWPESMFTQPWTEYSEGFAIPPEVEESPERFRRYVVALRGVAREETRRLAKELGCVLLLGVPTFDFQADGVRRFNSVLAVDQEGIPTGRYDKMHPVMFGEYVPLGEIFPVLYRLTPMGDGLTAGTAPLAVKVKGLRLSPCICFENTIPHLVRGHVRTLAARGEMPDALVTATNDGWFWGSSLLDTHLACGVYRAVESRLPMLIAANTGISSWIDAAGRIRDREGRRVEGAIVATITTRTNVARPYLWYGDVWAQGCLAALTIGVGWRMRDSFRSPQPS